MKLRGLVLGAMAAVAALVSCENLEQNPGQGLGAASIAISKTEVSFTEAGGDEEIQLTATRNWTMSADAEWVIVNPESGPASTSAQKVTVSALSNDGLNRTATITFTAGPKSKYLKVTQAGPGGSVEDKIVYSNDFQIEKTSEKPSMDTSYSIWDDKQGTGSENVTYAFGGKMSVRTTGKPSDDKGGYSNYPGSGGNNVFFGAATSILMIKNITLPSSERSYKLSFGGQRWDQDEPDALFSSDEFKVYISNDSQKWVELEMSHAEDAELAGDWNQFFASFTVSADVNTLGIAFVSSASSCYRIDDVLLEVGTEEGHVIDFANGIAISGATDGDPSAGSGSIEDLPEGTGEGTLASPYDAAKATRVASALADGEKVSGVYVKGKIRSIKKVDLATYGSATYYLTDADGLANFYVYGGKYLNNTKFTSEDQIKVGDEVVVLGDLINYMGNTPEMTSNNYIVELNGSTEAPEDTPSVPDTPLEPGEAMVVTVAQFKAAQDNSITYQLSGTVTGIYEAYTTQYNNIAFYLTDETGEVLIYRMSCEGVEDPSSISIGDQITVKGFRTLYNETPQMAQGAVCVEHVNVEVDRPSGGVKITFANKADRTVYTTSQQVWEMNGIKVTNDKASSTSNVGDYANPARFYKSSNLTIEYPGMTMIEFTCGSSDYANALKKSITSGTVEVLGSIVTVTLPAASDSYVITSLSAQVRVSELTVYTE